MTLNTRSLQGKIEDLRKVFRGCDYFCITESWLNNTIRDNDVSLPGMTILRNDRPCRGRRRGGGVACYVNNHDLAYTTICPELCVMNKNLEAIGILTTTPGPRQKVIITVYKPPRGNTKAAFIELLKLVRTPLIGNREVWILGDLNVNTKARNSTKFGYLTTFLRKSKLRYLPTGYTHYHPRGASVLDHVYTNCDKVSSHGLINDTVSDHVPVFVVKKQCSRAAHMKTITGRSYKNYNSVSAKQHMTNTDWSDVLTEDSPEQAYLNLISHVNDYLDTNCPIKTTRVPDVAFPIYDREVLGLIRKRKRNLRKARKVRQGIYNVYTARARKMMRKIKETLEKKRREKILSDLERFKKDPKSFWAILSSLWKGDREDKKISLVDGNGSRIDEDKTADYINSYYSNIGASLAAAFDVVQPIGPALLAPVIHRLDGVDANINCSLEKCGPGEVLKIVRNLQTTKSSGVENVRSKVIQDTLKAVPTLLPHIVNRTMEEVDFPKSWKVGTIIPLPKSGALSLVGNWRPVCLLNVCGKVCEKILHKQLLDHMLRHRLMSDNQFGFIPGRCPGDAIHGVSRDINKALNDGMSSAVLFLDLRKAFDTVNHIILLRKLGEYGLDNTAIGWFRSYLSQREQCTTANGSKSGVRPVPCGVPQGSVLGPLLFLVYINDVEDVILNTKAYMYADDLAIVSSGHDPMRISQLLQADTTAIGDWCRLNRLTVNTDKTQILWTYSRLSPPNLEGADVSLNGQRLLIVDQFNYLGVTLDKYMTLGPHISKVINLAKVRVAQLRRTRKYVDKDTCLLLYKQMVLPTMEYCPIMLDGAPAWGTPALQVQQNHALRACERIANPRDIDIDVLHANNTMEKLEERRNKQLLAHIYRLAKVPGNIVVPVRDLRGNDMIKLKARRPRKDIYYKCPLYRGCQLWNRLEADQQHQPTKALFMCSLKNTDLRPIERQ